MTPSSTLSLVTRALTGSDNMPSPDDHPETRLLDAAVAQFQEFGLRRTTIEDIAKRAKVDRATVYRRLGSKDAIIHAVLIRELQRLVERVEDAISDTGAIEDTIAAGFTTAILFFRGNLLYKRLLDADSETVLPKLTVDGGPLLEVAVAAATSILKQTIEKGQAEPVDQPEIVAEAGVRIVHSFLVTPRMSAQLETPEQIKNFALTVLSPMVTGKPRPASA